MVLKALTEVEDVPRLEVANIQAQALAEGDLNALNELAGVFAVLCNALLQNSAADDARPAGSSSDSAVPSRSSMRPASAIPASKLSSTDGLPATGEDPAVDVSDATAAADAAVAAVAAVGTAPAAAPVSSSGGMSGVGGATGALAAKAHAACAQACTESIAAAVASETTDAAARPKSARGRGPAKTVGGPHSGLLPSGKKACGPQVRSKNPSSCMHLHALSSAAAQRGATSARRPGTAPPAVKSVAPPPVDSGVAASGATSSHLQEEISELQQRILARSDEGPATARLGRALNDEFGARASSVYSSLIKQSLAGVRRAEALEVSRGVARDLNTRRDARIAAIRAQRVAGEVERAEQARLARRAAKEELSYRSLYSHAVTLERERLLLEAATGEEARRKTLQATRKRATALESFHMTQLNLLQEQLEQERQERTFREKVQTAMGAKLDAEARAQSAAALNALKAQLDHNEAMDATPLPIR